MKQEIEGKVFDILLQTLQRNTPKKPSYIRTNVYEGGAVAYKSIKFYCPKCEDNINSLYNFCSNCGQKIDWSDERRL